MVRFNGAWRPALPGIVACGAVAAVAACAEGGATIGPLVEGADAGEILDPDAGGSSPIQPTFGSTVTAVTPPPPISGGTLIVSRDGTHAIAADPDRDAVYVIDLSALSTRTIALHTNDQPGRLAEDGAGQVHVALRGAGAIATIDPVAGTVTARQTICPAPRGVAWDGSTDLVWVACATGEVVAIPAQGGAAVHSFVVERDLRDVLVNNGSVTVTEFRSASLLHLASDGTIATRAALPSTTSAFAAHVLWRAVPGPGGTMAAVHQESSLDEVTTEVHGGYGGCGGVGGGGGPLPIPPPPAGFDAGVADPGLDLAIDAEAAGDDAGDAQAPAVPEGGVDAGPGGFACTFSASVPQAFPLGALSSGSAGNLSCFLGGIVHSDLTLASADGSILLNTTIAGALPVDVALSGDGTLVAVATPGNTFGPGLSTVFEFGTCDQSTKIATWIPGSAEPTAVAFDSSNELLVQTREPAQLWIYSDSSSTPQSVNLAAGDSRKDTGHDIFHVQAGGMIACASCHPEGGDDGHVWDFDGELRRTPSLRGTIAGTAPYHWPGDMKDLPTLFNNVYTVRMSGATLGSDQTTVLGRWVESIPAPPAPSWVDSAAAARGKALFEQGSVGCSSCHSGAKLTNNQTLDVGTGGNFQVPPLVGVGWRAPFLHNGCAATFADRFGACASPGHGNTSGLTSSNLSDLETYLESL